MCDVLLQYVRKTLPDELSSSLEPYIQALEQGDFQKVLETEEAKLLLGHTESDSTKDIALSAYPNWTNYVFRRLSVLAGDGAAGSGDQKDSSAYLHHLYFLVALAALYSFVQSNITGPPLPFASAQLLFPSSLASSSDDLAKTRRTLLLSLGADGEAAYKLTPNVELLCLADAVLTSPSVSSNVKAVSWARLRSDFLHQRLLSDPAPSLQSAIYAQLETLAGDFLADGVQLESLPEDLKKEVRVNFLLERAAIHTHHGFDKKAREDLDRATSERKFSFALTGRMGKRTRYQEKDTSQLVVLARSAGTEARPAVDSQSGEPKDVSKPENLDLNDDTLLESISFTKQQPSSTEVHDEESLPKALRDIDPENQPLLDPLDSIILLLLASSIKNTSPENGLTREETLPYATRVLEGGSSNWQVYTQALLVRSRIEGFKSRTMERGLLQLQVLVDQVIAETTSSETPQSGETAATTFLPRAKEAESAPVSERLRFVFQIASPSRWELEAELAQRWVTLGGLRSALDIFARLEMWAEAALCWAATEREDRAKMIVRKQLFHATNGDDAAADEDTEKWEGAARDPPPADAPRLYCILGDIDKDPAMYEQAWEVSGSRYARAQRSLGRHWFAQRDYLKAANAYSKSLKVNQLNQQAWFAMGCALLQLGEFERAVEAFSRTVQLDDTDAEAWSNLAAALLHLDPNATEGSSNEPKVRVLDDDEEEPDSNALSQPVRDPQQYRRDALKAFKRAATLKFDNYRIWDNVMTVAATLSPPAFNDVVSAQKHIIDLRGATDGEKCVDVDILEMLVRHIITTDEDGYDPDKPGLTRMTVQLIDKQVVPLITSSKRLWQLVARLYLWRRKPSSALEAHEKAWRVVLAQPKWESSTEEAWNEAVEATIDLVDAYKSLGPMERTEGLSAGSGELVMKDWKFKSRSAIRSVMGKGKDAWEGTEGWEKLNEAMADLRAS